MTVKNQNVKRRVDFRSVKSTKKQNKNQNNKLFYFRIDKKSAINMNDHEDPRNAENLQDFNELPLRQVSENKLFLKFNF